MAKKLSPRSWKYYSFFKSEVTVFCSRTEIKPVNNIVIVSTFPLSNHFYFCATFLRTHREHVTMTVVRDKKIPHRERTTKICRIRYLTLKKKKKKKKN